MSDGDNITQLTGADFDEFIRFQNRSFDYPPQRGLDWMVPTMYCATDWHMRCNYALRRNGTLVGIVGLYPITWRIGRATLRIAGVGGVSTEPQSRGTGVMGIMLEHAKSIIREQGYPLSFLGGQRQRYRYFGWERCGTTRTARISKTCLRHQFREAPPVSLAVEAVDADFADAEALKAIYDAQPHRCDRDVDRFGAFLVQWGNHPFVARDEDGRLVGYAIFSRDEKTIFELVATDTERTFHLLRALVERGAQEDIALRVDGLAASVRQTIASFAEGLSAADSGNWQVFDWPAVLEVLMAARHAEQPMAPASVVIGIDDQQPTSVRMTVGADGPRCQATTETPAITATGPKMMQILFGPWPPSQVMTLPHNAAVLDAWCPLPLAIAKQDEV